MKMLDKVEKLKRSPPYFICRRRKLCWISKTFFQLSTIVALVVRGEDVRKELHAWPIEVKMVEESKYLQIYFCIPPIHLPYPLSDHIPDPFTCMQSLEAGLEWISSISNCNQNQCSRRTIWK